MEVLYRSCKCKSRTYIVHLCQHRTERRCKIKIIQRNDDHRADQNKYIGNKINIYPMHGLVTAFLSIDTDNIYCLWMQHLVNLPFHTLK